MAYRGPKRVGRDSRNKKDLFIVTCGIIWILYCTAWIKLSLQDTVRCLSFKVLAILHVALI
jgi:hypothetical protein